MLIEIAVKHLPTVREQEAGKPETLLLPLTQVVAETDTAAILRVGVEHAKALAPLGENLSRAVVIVRRVG